MICITLLHPSICCHEKQLAYDMRRLEPNDYGLHDHEAASMLGPFTSPGAGTVPAERSGMIYDVESGLPHGYNDGMSLPMVGGRGMLPPGFGHQYLSPQNEDNFYNRSGRNIVHHGGAGGLSSNNNNGSAGSTIGAASASAPIPRDWTCMLCEVTTPSSMYHCRSCQCERVQVENKGGEEAASSSSSGVSGNEIKRREGKDEHGPGSTPAASSSSSSSSSSLAVVGTAIRSPTAGISGRSEEPPISSSHERDHGGHQWQCQICTYVNTGDGRRCGVCDHAR
jgi:hypothetical protein